MKSLASLRRVGVRNDAPAPYVASRGGAAGAFGTTTAAGMSIEQQLRAMGGSGTLFAIVDALTTGVSAVRWDLCRDTPDGQPDAEPTIIAPDKHAAAALWARPNSFFTRSLLVETVQQHMELAAEGYILLVYAGGIPVEMWPARPDRMTPVPHPTKYLTGWIYTTPDGEKIPFRAEEVMQIRKPNPVDTYRGLSAVAAIGVDLEAEQLAAAWNRNFFHNSAAPGGVVEVPTSLNDAQFDEFTKRWQEQHRGVQRAHRVAVLEGGAKFTAMSITQRDMQFAELRQLSRDVIMTAWRVSKTALGITDDVNRAAALAAEYQFAKNLVTPRARRWEEALNFQLLPRFGATGKGVHFDFESPVQEDEDAENAERDSKVAAVVALTGAGWDPATTAEAYGLPELQYGSAASDPDRDLLTKLVTAAPAALGPALLPLLLPDLAEQIKEAFAEQVAAKIPPQLQPDPNADPNADPSTPPKGETPPQLEPFVAPPAEPDPAKDPTVPDDAPTAHHHEHERPELIALFGLRLDDAPEQSDLSAVQAAWQAALDRLMARWATRTATWRAQLRSQVSDLIDGEDLAGLASMHLDSDDAATTLSDALDALARTAGAQVVDAYPDVALTASVPADGFGLVAQTVAALLAAELAIAAGREALRVFQPGRPAVPATDDSPAIPAVPASTGAQVSSEVDTALEQRSSATTEAQLGGALTGAQNAARIETLCSGPVGSIYADETLDANTCPPCRAISGRFVCTTEDLKPYERLYTRMGGYVGCQGGVRCRGTVTGVWRPETTDEPLIPEGA